MLYKDFYLELGAALKSAKIIDSKFDSCGYGEITLRDKDSHFGEMIFSYQDGDWSHCHLLGCEYCCDNLSMDDIEEINREIDWSRIFDEEFIERLERQCDSHAGGDYYDFYLGIYESEKKYLLEEVA